MRLSLKSRAVLLAAALAATERAHAQALAEGTVITNSASATYTDANNGTYAAVTASVSVTIGFVAGLDVTSNAAATPASPSTGNVATFTVNNIANGRDSVAVVVAAVSGLSYTGFRFNGTTYADLTALNAALAAFGIPADSSVSVDVIYEVGPALGGVAIAMAFTATSLRDPLTTDVATMVVTPAITGTVAVTPDAATQDHIPSNGTNYSYTFTVTNGASADHTFSLTAAAAPGTAVSIVSVNGTAGSAGTVTVASGASAGVTVVYSVGNQPAGVIDVLTLTAIAVGNPTITDVGDVTIRVVRPAVIATKVAYRDDQSAIIGVSDRVVSGETVQYKISFTNAGGASAASVQVTDTLPSQLTLVSAAGDADGWTIVSSGNAVTANLAALAAGETRYVWVRARIN